MRNWFVLGLILGLMLASGCCRKTVAPMAVSVQEQKDSIREVIKERVVHIHDSIPFYVPIEKIVNVYPLPPEDTSKVETSLAMSMAFIDGNGLFHHTIENKEQTIYKPVDMDVQVADTTREEFHQDNSSDTVYVDVPAQLSGGQKFLINAGWAMMALILLGIIRIVAKLWRKR